jgi:hypothetical protein
MYQNDMEFRGIKFITVFMKISQLVSVILMFLVETRKIDKVYKAWYFGSERGTTDS